MPPKCLVLNHSIALINCKLFATSERTVILEVYLEDFAHAEIGSPLFYSMNIR
jgi:hypothetical protein